MSNEGRLSFHHHHTTSHPRRRSVQPRTRTHPRGLHLPLTTNDNSTHHSHPRTLLFTIQNTARHSSADTRPRGILIILIFMFGIYPGQFKPRHSPLPIYPTRRYTLGAPRRPARPVRNGGATLWARWARGTIIGNNEPSGNLNIR
jgi:hypothetical protein